eukprot:UN0556
MEVRFTHGRISAAFKSGMKLDTAIKQILKGYSAEEYPPLETVWHAGCLYSLSNRRLFVWRVLTTLQAVGGIRVIIHPPGDGRIKSSKWDDRWGRKASKWERAYTTYNDGVSVKVDSAYLQYHSTCNAGSKTAPMQKPTTHDIRDKSQEGAREPQSLSLHNALSLASSSNSVAALDTYAPNVKQAMPSMSAHYQWQAAACFHWGMYPDIQNIMLQRRAFGTSWQPHAGLAAQQVNMMPRQPGLDSHSGTSPC